MKRARGKPRAKSLHTPIAELQKAQSTPQTKRAGSYNRLQRREKEYTLARNGIKVVQHTR